MLQSDRSCRSLRQLASMIENYNDAALLHVTCLCTLKMYNFYCDIGTCKLSYDEIIIIYFI